MMSCRSVFWEDGYCICRRGILLCITKFKTKNNEYQYHKLIKETQSCSIVSERSLFFCAQLSSASCRTGWQCISNRTEWWRKIVGCAIVGRPVARMLDDRATLEVTRLCSDGSGNACSMLYSACWHIAKEMGYKRMITYILNTEPGSSLKGAGWLLVGERGGGSWDVPSRRRNDKHPLQRKFLFQVTTQ